jgi:hypothetical protein
MLTYIRLYLQVSELTGGTAVGYEQTYGDVSFSISNRLLA